MFQIIVIINNIIPYNKQYKSCYRANTLNECKNHMITFVADNFKSLNIDFPYIFEDFEYIWFDNNRIETDSFFYIIIPINVNSTDTLSWNEPWTLEEIYEEVLEKLYEYELLTTNDNSESDNDSN